MGDTASGDSSELEALFDSIASGPVKSAAPALQPQPEPAAAAKPSLLKQALESDDSTEDSNDLQALFDSVSKKLAAAKAREARAAEASEDWPVQEKVFQKVGVMARQLHDILGDLGYDKLIEKTVSAPRCERPACVYRQSNRAGRMQGSERYGYCQSFAGRA